MSRCSERALVAILRSQQLSDTSGTPSAVTIEDSPRPSPRGPTNGEVLDFMGARTISARTDSFMAQEYDVLIERDQDGTLVASVPALPGCHTQAHSLDDLMERVKEAITLCLEERGQPPDNLVFVGIQRVRVS